MRLLTMILTVFVLIVGLQSCNEEEDFTSDSSARLYFSADTVRFDTLFTSVGSTTNCEKSADAIVPKKKSIQ